MKKMLSIIAIISLGFAGFALSACSNKQEAPKEESVKLFEKKCCEEIADLNETFPIKVEPINTAQMHKIIEERKRKGKHFNHCFEKEIQKARAEKKEFISVDYLNEKCGSKQKIDKK